MNGGYKSSEKFYKWGTVKKNRQGDKKFQCKLINRGSK